MDEKELERIANELRRMIRTVDECEAEENISAAIVYIECARQNLMTESKSMVYAISPQIVVRHISK